MKDCVRVLENITEVAGNFREYAKSSSSINKGRLASFSIIPRGNFTDFTLKIHEDILMLNRFKFVPFSENSPFLDVAQSIIFVEI